MKLSEAIELLTEMSEPGIVAFDKQDLDAIKLGVEALERIQNRRTDSGGVLGPKLPGETPEEEAD